VYINYRRPLPPAIGFKGYIIKNTILFRREKINLDINASLLLKILLKRPVINIIKRYSPRVY